MVSGNDPQVRRTYFDTVAFREIGGAFDKEQQLSLSLRERIIISPITVVEVLSQLTIARADEVLRQVQAVHNWCNPEHAGLLPWPDDWLFSVWFQKPAPDNGYTERMQKAINVCLAADSVKSLEEDAGKLKDAMDRMRQQTADAFGGLVEQARRDTLEDEKFSNAWFSGIANRVKADPASKSLPEIISELSAYHEFERVKLQIAVRSKDYNPQKHKNDLLDAEQLIYLADPSLYFLTCDTGFQKFAAKSAQAPRIITVPQADLADAKKIETLLCKMLQM